MRGVVRLTVGSERGIVFLSALVLVLVMTLLGAALFDLSHIERVLVTGDAASTQSIYCAEAALMRTVNDPGRISDIGNVPLEGSLTWTGVGLSLPGDDPDLATPSGPCRNVTVTFNHALGPRLTLTALLDPPQTGTTLTARGAQIQLIFLEPAFEYAVVSNSGQLHLRGRGPVPPSGAGGRDRIDGDVFVSGPPGSLPFTPAAVLGEPLTGQEPTILPRETDDTRPTISLPLGTTFTVHNNSPDFFPATGDTLPQGYQSNMPQPNVVGYVSNIKQAAGITPGNPTGNLTGTHQGSPVYNLKKIFDTLGRNSDGSLTQPSGCGCTGSPGGNCKVFCDLQPLGIKLNPTSGGAVNNRSQEIASTPGDDYFFDGACQSGGFPCNPNVNVPLEGPDNAGKTGTRGAQRKVALARDAPPVFLVEGNAWFHAKDAWGIAIEGRGTIVATNDVLLADNVIYMHGITNDPAVYPDSTNPATADMLGLVAQRDLWFGDPNFGTFLEGSGVMLAGRDFNFVFFKADGTCCAAPEDNGVTLNGTMLANRQVALLRDFAHPTRANANCPPSSTACKPVAYFPVPSEDGTILGVWKFVKRLRCPEDGCPVEQDGQIVIDPAPTSNPVTNAALAAGFIECGAPGLPSCTGAGVLRRRISHYQMSINYERRLFTNAELVPPGLPTGLGQIFAGWHSWRQCPPCD